jgi:hypothetical protein
MLPPKFLHTYYFLRPIIPRSFQINARRFYVARKLRLYRDIWPIDKTAAKKPTGWTGWPGGKKFSLVLTHDVDTEKGMQKCMKLINLEEELGFRSSFNFVPRRYPVSDKLREEISKKKFEIGVHGLFHDGKLYNSKQIFLKRATEINQYIKEWKAVGFRSPAMHHNLNWIGYLDIEYDCSTFDTDPFEAQPDGVKTIFPFWVANNNRTRNGFVELPYTLPQDFTLFVLMGKKNIDIWKSKLDWIAEKGGMALINCHPDYMHFGGNSPDMERYPVKYYKEILEYIKQKYSGLYWHVLPKQMAMFWSQSFGPGKINGSNRQ